MHKDIEALRSATLPSLEEQATSIGMSVIELNAMDAELKDMIAELYASTQTMDEKLAAAKTTLDNFKQTTSTEISTARTEFLEKIEGLDESISAQIETAETTMEGLKLKQASLQGKIDSLRGYMNELFATKDWVSGTFGTLEKQEAILSDMATIKSQVIELSAEAEEIGKTLKEEVLKTIADFKAKYSDEIAAKAQGVTDAYLLAISQFEESFNEKVATEIENKFAASEAKVKDWLVKELADKYYRADSAKAQIEVFEKLLGRKVDSEGKSLQEEIDIFKADLDTAKAVLTRAYKKAIADSLTKHELKFSNAMADSLADITTNIINPLVNTVSGLKTQVAELATQVDALREKIETVEGQTSKIQESITILEQYDNSLEAYIEAVKALLRNADKTDSLAIAGMINTITDSLQNSEKSYSLISQIEALKTLVGQKSSLPDSVKTDFSTWVSSTIASFEAQMNTKASIEQANTIVNGINSLLGADSVRLAHAKNNLDSLFIKSESTIQGWIDEKLGGYYTIGELKGKLDGMTSELNSMFTNGDDALQAKIDALGTKLKTDSSNVVKGYADLIAKTLADSNGFVNATIKTAFENIDASLTDLEGKVSVQQDSVKVLQKKMNAVAAKRDALKNSANSLKNFHDSQDYSSLNGLIQEVTDSIATLKQGYANRDSLEAMAVTVSDLKVKVDSIAKVDSMLAKVNEQISVLKEFFDVKFGSDTTLYDVLSGIDASLSELNEIVAPTGGKSMMERLSDFAARLNKIESKIDSLSGLITSNVSSITYIPKYIDQKEYFSISDGKYSGSFRFLIKPEKIASFIDENCASVKYLKNGATTPFDSQTFKYEGNGVVRIDVSDSATNLKDAGFAALYVQTDTVSFTSDFIPIAINGSSRFYVNPDNIVFTKDRGSKTVKIVSPNSSNVKWNVIPSNANTSSSSVGWLSISKKSDEITISAAANDNRLPREATIEFTYSKGSDNFTCYLKIRQDGNPSGDPLYCDLNINGEELEEYYVGYTKYYKISFTLYNEYEEYPYIYMNFKNNVIVNYVDDNGDEHSFPESWSNALEKKKIRIVVTLTSRSGYRFGFILNDSKDHEAAKGNPTLGFSMTNSSYSSTKSASEGKLILTQTD